MQRQDMVQIFDKDGMLTVPPILQWNNQSLMCTLCAKTPDKYDNCDKCGALYCHGCRILDAVFHKTQCRTTAEWSRYFGTHQQTLYAYNNLVITNAYKLATMFLSSEPYEAVQLVNALKYMHLIVIDGRILCQIPINLNTGTAWINTLKPANQALVYSGCLVAHGFALAVSTMMRPITRAGTTDMTFLSGTDIAKASLASSLVASMPEPHPCRHIVIADDVMDFDSKNGGQILPLITKDIDAKARAFYYVLIAPCVKRKLKGGPMTADIKSDLNVKVVEHWKTTTAETTDPDEHHFGILVNRDSGFIIQAYYGMYTVSDWLNFDVKLARNSDLPDSEHKKWTADRTVEQPKYRGVLDTKCLKSLAILIDSIADGSRVLLHDITGVRLDAALVPKKYNITFYRVAF